MLLGFDGFSAADFFAAAVGSQDQGATFGGGGQFSNSLVSNP